LFWNFTPFSINGHAKDASNNKDMNGIVEPRNRNGKQKPRGRTMAFWTILMSIKSSSKFVIVLVYWTYDLLCMIIFVFGDLHHNANSVLTCVLTVNSLFAWDYQPDQPASSVFLSQKNQPAVLSASQISPICVRRAQYFLGMKKKKWHKSQRKNEFKWPSVQKTTHVGRHIWQLGFWTCLRLSPTTAT
jgi:hypothetical protein